MGKMKYLLCSILIFAAILFNYEIYQNYMYSFEDFYNTSFYLPKDMKTEDMFMCLTESAEANQVEIFYIDNISEGDFRTQVTVYCSEKMKGYLENKYWVKEGIHTSLLSGTTVVVYCDFQELFQHNMEEKTEKFYLLGQRV